MNSFEVWRDAFQEAEEVGCHEERTYRLLSRHNSEDGGNGGTESHGWLMWEGEAKNVGSVLIVPLKGRGH